MGYLHICYNTRMDRKVHPALHISEELAKLKNAENGMFLNRNEGGNFIVREGKIQLYEMSI
jgi:hypothetical protein